MSAPAPVSCPHPVVQRVVALVAALSLAVFSAMPRAWDSSRLQQVAEHHGPRAVDGARALASLIGTIAAQDEVSRLSAVNEFFNRRISFREDAEAWGQADYWASPVEMFDKGFGDCEDYAAAKYFTLLATGVSEARLRMVYVRLQIGGPGGTQQAHMVLAYYPEPNAEPLILDNVVGAVRPASRRPDLAPVFSFNSEGLWQGVGSVTAGDPVARLSNWRSLLTKARNEGFL